MKDDRHVLIGTYIRLNKEKVEREGVYDYDALLRRLDYIFEYYNLMPLENGCLYGNKIGASYKEADESQTRAMIYLGKCKWFVENVQIWVMSFNYSDETYRKWNDVIRSYNEVLGGIEKYVE